MDKDQIISLLRKNKSLLKENFNILKIGLFGSYSTNTNTKESDLDIVYELEEGKRMGFKEADELEKFFVKVFKIDNIDLINNKYMNPIIGEEVSKTVIYV